MTEGQTVRSDLSTVRRMAQHHQAVMADNLEAQHLKAVKAADLRVLKVLDLVQPLMALPDGKGSDKKKSWKQGRW